MSSPTNLKALSNIVGKFDQLDAVDLRYLRERVSAELSERVGTGTADQETPQPEE